MDKMEMMKEKFIMFAEKLWVSPENIEKIKEDLNKTSEIKNEIKEEVKEEVKEEIMPEMDKEKDVIKVDIAKPVEDRIPSEEDLAKMDRNELLILAKRLMNTPKPEEKGASPFVVMMKKHGY